MKDKRSHLFSKIPFKSRVSKAELETQVIDADSPVDSEKACPQFAEGTYHLGIGKTLYSYVSDAFF